MADPAAPAPRPFLAAAARQCCLDQEALRSPAEMRAHLARELLFARDVVEAATSGDEPVGVHPSEVFRVWALSVELWLLAARPAEWLAWNAVDWVDRMRWNHGSDRGAPEERRLYEETKRALFEAAGRAYDDAGAAAAAVVEKELAMVQ